MAGPHASDYFMQDAVRDIRALGVDVEDRAYGFRLSHHDSTGIYHGECGGEHDGSVSLHLFGNQPYSRWYFRFSVREMAEFIASSCAKVSQGKFESLLTAMEDSDRDYDYQELPGRLEAHRASLGD